MEKKELVQEFINILSKFRRIIHESSNISLEDKFATILQMQALSFLKENPSSTVGQLSQRLHVSSPSVAQLCDRLVNSGWIKREDDQKDRRVTHLLLSREGEKKLKEIKLKHFKKMSMTLSLLDEKDLKDMTRIMTTLVSKVEEK